jgi:hypothetical protein
MKNLIIFLSMVLLTCSMAVAQQGGGNGNGDGSQNGECDGYGYGEDHGRNGGQGENGGPHGSGYDLSAVVTVTGEVVEMDFCEDDGVRRQKGNASFYLRTEANDLYFVNVAPAWFMENQEFPLAVGDVVTVTGALTQRQEECQLDEENITVILAAEIVNGELVLVLRDELGYPVWRGTRGADNGRNPGTYVGYDYDPAAETVVQGIVAEIAVGCTEENTYPGYQLILTLGDGSELMVVLGPYWYLVNQEMDLTAGTDVVITGVYVTLDDGSEIFIARLVEYDDTTIVLRDETGTPLWKGVRRGNGQQ